MKKYFFARLIQLVPILFGITFLTFGLMQFAADDAVDKIFEQSGSVAKNFLSPNPCAGLNFFARLI